MGLTFLATERDELPELARFLAGAFGLPETAPFIEPKLLEWKCFSAHPHWPGPRSFVLRQDGRMVAHGCAHPAAFLTPDGEVTTTRVIDWAAAPAAPGSGVLLFRKFGALADTLLAAGGSEETRSILPRIGFRRVGEVSMYARPVRPWRQFFGRMGKGWRQGARLMRNLRWARASLVPAPEGFSAVRVRAFACIPGPAAQAEFTPARRSRELLNYMLECPGAAFSGYEIRKGSELRGYFVLSVVRGQARIADLWVEAAGDWRTAVSLAAREAAADPGVCEVAATASIDPLRRAIEENGFQPRGSEPLFLYDRKGLLAGAPPLHVQLLDGDECYLENPEDPYWT